MDLEQRVSGRGVGGLAVTGSAIVTSLARAGSSRRFISRTHGAKISPSATVSMSTSAKDALGSGAAMGSFWAMLGQGLTGILRIAYPFAA